MTSKLIFFSIFSLSLIACSSKHKDKLSTILNNYKKVEIFSDPCTKDWTGNWTLDGTRASVSNAESGMVFWAGPENRNDTCHAVLWTKKSFEGNVLIQYEYTKLDTQKRNVNIIYIQATGEKPFGKNVHEWSKEREVPSMFKYFHNLNTLHISYAAYPVQGSNSDYVRARRYMPLTKTLKNTEFGESYENTGLFKKDVTYQISIAKIDYDVYMKVKSDEQEQLFNWNYNAFPIIEEGYIGLRHMYTRGAKYRNFKVYELCQ